MNIIIIVLVLFCGYKIYSSKGQRRFNWFVCSVMIFSSSIIIISKPQIPCHRLFLICYWLSVLRYKENIEKKIPLKVPLLIYVIVLMVISFNSPHLNIFYKIYKPFVFLIDTYLILLLANYGVKTESFTSKVIINTLLFVTLYGVLTFLTSHNPIQENVASAFGHTLLDGYYFGDRIRITSTWSHPIAYGLVCGALFYEYLPYWRKRKIQILMLLLAVNVFLCGSRTALATFLLMGGIIILTRYSINRAIRQAIIICLLLIPTYLVVPLIREKVDSMINTALGKDDVDGSSFEMRDEQTYYTMLIVAEKPILGHGLDYIQEVMGYNTDNFKGDWHLLGFESYSYILLIERGFIGFFLELFIWLSIVSYAFVRRKKNTKNSSLIIAYTIGFAFFSFSTGTLDTKIPMFFMVGVSLSQMNKNKLLNNKILTNGK